MNVSMDEVGEIFLRHARHSCARHLEDTGLMLNYTPLFKIYKSFYIHLTVNVDFRYRTLNEIALIFLT